MSPSPYLLFLIWFNTKKVLSVRWAGLSIPEWSQQWGHVKLTNRKETTHLQPVQFFLRFLQRLGQLLVFCLHSPNLKQVGYLKGNTHILSFEEKNKNLAGATTQVPGVMCVSVCSSPSSPSSLSSSLSSSLPLSLSSSCWGMSELCASASPQRAAASQRNPQHGNTGTSLVNKTTNQPTNQTTSRNVLQ